MARDVVRRLTRHGIGVKGYFILGFPTETAEEIDATAALIRDLRNITEPMRGRFRASAFKYRPYPGTPDWTRLLATGRYTPAELLNYSAVDLTGDGLDEAMRERGEFNFSQRVGWPGADAHAASFADPTATSIYLARTSDIPAGRPACPVPPGSARGPETMGNNRHEPGNPGMRTGRPTRWSDGPFHPRLTRETAGQRPKIYPLRSCRAITIRWIWFVPS